MKNIITLLAFIIAINSWAVAPYGIKGQAQSGTLYSNVHQFPNNQVTNTGGINALVETGNKNILINPSFEHLTFSTGWTNSAGTFTEETVIDIDGLKSAKVTLSAQALALSQDSTLYQAQFADGVQGLATVRVKTTVAGLRVCARQAGNISSNLCVNVQSNGKWGLYKVPFILGATSNGISINSNAATVTGDVYVDDAFVGATAIAADVDQSRIAGESYFAGTAGCTWSRTNTSVGGLTATAACPGPTIVLQNTGQWQTTDSDLPRQTVNNLPAGTYKAKFYLYHNPGASGQANAFAITDGTTTCEPVGGSTFTTEIMQQVVECSFTYTSPGNRSFELLVGSVSSSIIVRNTNVTPRASTKFILEYYGSGTTYSSTNADTDWASCGHTTSDFTGFGTVSAIETQCKREGSDLLMRGKFTSGVPTATEGRVNLKLGGISLTSKNSSSIASLQVSGITGINVAGSFSFVTLTEPSVGYITFGRQDASSSALTKANGSVLAGTGSLLSFHARIPIEGWQNSNIIIGQFNGLESCTNTLECTDVFSAEVSSAGVVSSENIDWINGNATVTDTSLYTFTWKTGVFTTNPNCAVNATNGSQNFKADKETIPTSTTGAFRTANSTTGAKAATGFTIICQKQGVDYIGKTAKAVASDQNVSTPGTIKSTFCSAKISSTGVISDQKGGCFASCTNATLPVCTFTSSYWVSGQIPNCWHSSDSGAFVGQSFTTSTTFSGNLYNSSSVGISGARAYFCHGERQ
jgi:hypothetical protein